MIQSGSINVLVRDNDSSKAGSPVEPKSAADKPAAPQQQQQQEVNAILRYGSLALLIFQNCAVVLLVKANGTMRRGLRFRNPT